MSRDTAFQIIETAKAYPKKSMGEIRDIVYEIRKDGWWESEFRFQPQDATGDCMSLEYDAMCLRGTCDETEAAAYIF